MASRIPREIRETPREIAGEWQPGDSPGASRLSFIGVFPGTFGGPSGKLPDGFPWKSWTPIHISREVAGNPPANMGPPSRSWSVRYILITDAMTQVESINTATDEQKLNILPPSNIGELYLDKRIRVGFLPGALNTSGDSMGEIQVIICYPC